jgi:hypothetical protein
LMSSSPRRPWWNYLELEKKVKADETGPISPVSGGRAGGREGGRAPWPTGGSLVVAVGGIKNQ